MTGIGHLSLRRYRRRAVGGFEELGYTASLIDGEARVHCVLHRLRLAGAVLGAHRAAGDERDQGFERAA